MKKSTYRWLFIGANFMLVVTAVCAIAFQNMIDKSIFFIGAFCSYILAVIYLFEIKSVLFGGLSPKISWTLKIFKKNLEEKGDTETYVKSIKRIVRTLLILATVLLAAGLAEVLITALIM